MIPRLLPVLLLLSCSNAKVSEPLVESESTTLSTEIGNQLMEQLELDPNPELNVFVFIEQKLTRDATIMSVHQSRQLPKGGVQSAFKHKGHEVFVYSSAEQMGDIGIYFETDSPSWKILMILSSGEPQFYAMELLSQSTRDSNRTWSLN